MCTLKKKLTYVCVQKTKRTHVHASTQIETRIRAKPEKRMRFAYVRPPLAPASWENMILYIYMPLYFLISVTILRVQFALIFSTSRPELIFGSGFCT